MKTEKMSNQSKQILEHLQAGLSISDLEALEKFKCRRLAARIYDLKKCGWPIDKRTRDVNGSKIAEYFMAKYDETKNNEKQLRLF